MGGKGPSISLNFESESRHKAIVYTMGRPRSSLQCSLCAKDIHFRKVVDPQHDILCTACAVDKCPKCPLGAKGLPKQLTDGHDCVIMVNTASTRPPGKDSKAERLTKGWKTCDSKLPGGRERLKASGLYASGTEACAAFGWKHGPPWYELKAEHLLILNQQPLLEVMQTGEAGSDLRADALLDVFAVQLVLPSQSDPHGDNQMALVATEKLVSAIQTGKHIATFDIEKHPWYHYKGEYLRSSDPIVIIDAPPHNGLPTSNRLVYDAAIGSFHPETLELQKTYFNVRLPPAAIADFEIFTGAQMQQLDDGMRAASDAGHEIFHCDGDEGTRLEAVGCKHYNLHRVSQKVLGIGYGGGRPMQLPDGLGKFSIAENVIATLLLLPKLTAGETVTLPMMQSVVGHTAEGDAFRTMLPAHLPILRAAMRRDAERQGASRPAKKQKK